MATTPPAQITRSPQTPLTPLHGAAYDHEDSPRRTSARLRQKRAIHESTSQSTIKQTRFEKTPNSPRWSRPAPHSPDQTPKRKSSNSYTRIMSPPSPDSDAFNTKPTDQHATNHQQFLSVTTAMGDGMLPTPVKTPSKKQKTIGGKSSIAARALFQDQLASEDMVPSPRKNRKSKRYNGFSLESFRAENGDGTGVHIFTDSRDQVPEVDQDQDNPFNPQEAHGVTSQRVSGTAKRRKVSQSRQLDPQVEEALQDDEGMVYVFRGKKVYRRFDDAGEEEEEIDADDLGLLEHSSNGRNITRPLRTLTRKSIKPTRLFQTEQQKRVRELEKEEEAATDIDDNVNNIYGSNSEHEKDPKPSTLNRGKGKGRIDRSVGRPPAVALQNDSPKGSPFDSWVRVKPGSGSSSGAKSARGRKRVAAESVEEPLLTST